MNRDACGFSLSFLIHASILAVCFYLLPSLDLQPKPLVIDFSLISSACSVKDYIAPPKQTQPLQQPPPKPQQLALPMPIKKVLPPAPKKLSRPVEKILPKKEEKPVKEESYPEEVQRMVLPEPAVLPSEPLAQSPVVEKESPSLAGIPAAPPAPVATRQEMENHYVKSHFVYIKKIIEKNISYPQMARRMGWQGKVVLSFIVCGDGEVEELHIVESSGYTQLDRNAVETVRQVVPFPRPPVRVKLVLPVTYKIS